MIKLLKFIIVFALRSYTHFHSPLRLSLNLPPSLSLTRLLKYLSSYNKLFVFVVIFLLRPYFYVGAYHHFPWYSILSLPSLLNCVLLIYTNSFSSLSFPCGLTSMLGLSSLLSLLPSRLYSIPLMYTSCCSSCLSLFSLSPYPCTPFLVLLLYT